MGFLIISLYSETRGVKLKNKLKSYQGPPCSIFLKAFKI
ncbi:hypothetical protein HPHPP41_0382 [Helicobacter pylori Hp P-41]|nr:hypothetical protein HPHPP41_0382 [Helicobacter pylori Hp P-41]